MFQSCIVVARASGRSTEGVVAAIVGRKLVLIAAESTWVACRQLIPPLPVRRVRSPTAPSAEAIQSRANVIGLQTGAAASVGLIGRRA